MNNIKNSSVKAMTLFETMITICVSTLLFISLATSFYTFRVLNTNTIDNSKKELGLMSIKGYVEANTDRIVSNKIGGICMYVDTDEIKDGDYELYLYDGFYYIVNVSDKETFTNSSRRQTAKIASHLGEIALFKNDGNGNTVPITNLNGDYIIKLDVTEFYNNMRFIYYDNHDPSAKEKDKLVPTRFFNDFGRDFYDQLGESIYYYKQANGNSFDGLFDKVFEYGTFDDGVRKSNCLRLFLNGESEDGEIIFDNLPYDYLTMNYSVDYETYSMIETMSSRNIRPVVAIEEEGRIVELSGYKYGVAYVSETDESINQATVSARELLFYGSDFKEIDDTKVAINDCKRRINATTDQSEKSEIISEQNELEEKLEKLYRQLSLSEDEIPSYEASTNYTYKFRKWIVEDMDYSTDLDIYLDIPAGNTDKKVIAVFSKQMTPVTDTTRTIDQGLRNTVRGTYLVASYGLQPVVAITSDEGSTYTYINNNNYGVGFVSNSSISGNSATLSARELTFTIEDLYDLAEYEGYVAITDENGNITGFDEDNEYYEAFMRECKKLGIDLDSLPDKVIDRTKDYCYKFRKWIVDGREYNDNNIIVSLSNTRNQKRCVAVFDKQLTPINDEISPYLISHKLRNTFSTKEVYIVNCDISYREKNYNTAAEAKSVRITAGVYYKYYPEVFTGEKQEEFTNE